MLHITAKPGDTIYIGHDICIHFDISNTRRIRLGIKAPQQDLITRKSYKRRTKHGNKNQEKDNNNEHDST